MHSVADHSILDRPKRSRLVMRCTDYFLFCAVVIQSVVCQQCTERGPSGYTEVKEVKEVNEDADVIGIAIEERPGI